MCRIRYQKSDRVVFVSGCIHFHLLRVVFVSGCIHFPLLRFLAVLECIAHPDEFLVFSLSFPPRRVPLFMGFDLVIK